MGFHILGSFPSTAIFRQLRPDPPPVEREEFFGQAAEEAVDSIMDSRPAKHHERIWELTQDDLKKGFGTGPYARRHLDAIFGKGRWRPLHDSW